MTQVFDENNRIVPVTVVAAGPCVVTQVRTPDVDGYAAVQIGYGAIDPRKVNKPDGRPLRQGRRHAAPPRRSSCAPTTPPSTRSARRSPPSCSRPASCVDVSRHQQGQGLRRCHEAPRLPGRRAPPTARTATTASRARSAAAPPRAGCSRACGWPAGWAASAPPPRTSPSTRSTPSKGLLLIKGAVPGPKGGLVARPHRRRREPTSEHRHRRGVTIEPTDRSRRLHRRRQDRRHRRRCPADVFDVQVNIPLIHQVVVAQLAAARQGTHSTKTRGEVRGGGRKPYRQKGTGRARQGSTRAPQFAGGGVVHGPTPRSYAQRTPKKMKAAALRGALSDRARNGRVHVVSGLVDGDGRRPRPRSRVLRRPLRAQARARGRRSATTS